MGVWAGQRGVDDKREGMPCEKKMEENAKRVHGGAGRGSITRIVSLLSLPSSGLTDFQTIVSGGKKIVADRCEKTKVTSLAAGPEHSMAP